MRPRSVATTLLLTVAVAVAGCNDKALQGQRRVDGGAVPSSLTAEQSSKVLAKIGDHTITLGDYVAALEHMDQFDRLRYQSPERRKELLTEMIDVELLATEAKRKGYDKDPLAQQEMREILRDALLQQSRKGAPVPNDVPENEVHAYYDQHRDEFRDSERRRVSAIVLPNAAAGNDALEAAKKATTPSLWGELVRARSVDPQAKANVPVDLAGDFGMVSAVGDSRGDNQRVPATVRAGVFEIEMVGDVLGHVVTDGLRYFVVRLTQKTEAHDRSFAEAERSIRVKLAQDKLKQRDEELVAALRAKFPVVIDEAALASVNVDLSDAGPDASLGGGGLPRSPGGRQMPGPPRGGMR